MLSGLFIVVFSARSALFLNRPSSIVHDPASAPLTPAELDALQSLSKGFAADQLAQDADTIYTSLADAIAPEEAQEEEPVANSCNQYGHEEGCTGATQRAQKGGRATKGNPRAKTTRSNTPLKAAPAAKPQAKVDAIDHALKSTQKGGKNVMGAATIDKKPLDILGGHPSTEGSSHAARHFGPGETDRRSLAKSIVHGDKKQDRTETSSVRKDYKAILATHGKGEQARTKLITTRPKLDSD